MVAKAEAGRLQRLKPQRIPGPATNCISATFVL